MSDDEQPEGEEDYGAEIIAFPLVPGGDAIGPPAGIIEKNPGYGSSVSYPGQPCAHRQCDLNMTAHRMYCRDCKQELDCFDWIVNYSRKWRRFNVDYKQAVHQAKDAHARVAELERKERNLKSRIRRHGVLLTAGQARTLREQFHALRNALSVAHAPLLRDGEVGRAQARALVAEQGVRFEKHSEILNVLEGKIADAELEETS